jgi:hypothetical protein
VGATWSPDLKSSPKNWPFLNFLLIYPSHTRQIQVETEISSMMFYYRFFVFLPLFIILNFDASDGMYVENDYINYTNWVGSVYSCSFPCIYLRVTAGCVTIRTTGGSWFDIWKKQEVFVSSKASTLALDLSQPSIRRMAPDLFIWVY